MRTDLLVRLQKILRNTIGLPDSAVLHLQNMSIYVDICAKTECDEAPVAQAPDSLPRHRRFALA